VTAKQAKSGNCYESASSRCADRWGGTGMIDPGGRPDGGAGRMTEMTATSLVCAGLVSVLVFPAVAIACAKSLVRSPAA
jgi:hypothetical protein